MPANYVLLGEVTLGASAASVTFSNIPQTGYTDLKLVCSARGTQSSVNQSYQITFNGTSTTGLSMRRVYGNGASAASDSGLRTIEAVGATATANTFSNDEIYIPNYTSNNNKSYSVDNVSENNATTAYAIMHAGLWSNTAAITSIVFTGVTGSFVSGSTFYLYGLAAVGTTPVIAPFASGGDIVTNDGTYWIHTFLSSGTFTPAKNLTCDYLVVAGGAAGGGANNPEAGGGGGAGGLRSTVTATGGGGSLESALSLTAQGYTVTVGAGGAGAAANGANGSNSVFSTITSIGGGGGRKGTAGVIGGSGGGGGAATGAAVGGAGTANQGFAGGTGGNGGSGFYAPAGGGGAGAVGINAVSVSQSGGGGAGVATLITGSSVTYAGGGGGGGAGVSGGVNAGAGGSGGGGAGGTSGIGTAGTINTGGGGGGTYGSTTAGAAGGSGIVIIRYPIA
jgi:hypothetical protein